MDPRQQESSQCKSSTMPHRERSEELRDKKPSEVPIKHDIEEEKQTFRRMRSPPRPRITGSFRQRFGGRFYRPRFIRDDHSFRKPRFSFGFQRYHPFTPRPRFNWRDQSGPPGPPGPPQGPPGPNNQYNKQRNMDRSSTTRASTPKEHTSALRSSAGSSRAKEKQPVSFTVYRQDCDTFGLVVKMLIAKDPSLERPIQPSLKENLGEIGLRCVEAMQQFIEEYDSREPSPQ
ncbi:uncharacterized protein LOC121538592 isoform X4 [Coregonus clupeaformis]|uniref:uncharacterized protein LOC121538592 isoform X4 n=1 Tax=Coregonus clupeaformis TaxID=59861 RepID=UPI001BDFCC41|nr:uncharacterized protein LOC121538592 isoform X4 [Coregonus clupeaformis]